MGYGSLAVKSSISSGSEYAQGRVSPWVWVGRDGCRCRPGIPEAAGQSGAVTRRTGSPRPSSPRSRPGSPHRRSRSSQRPQEAWWPLTQCSDCCAQTRIGCRHGAQRALSRSGAHLAPCRRRLWPAADSGCTHSTGRRSWRNRRTGRQGVEDHFERPHRVRRGQRRTCLLRRGSGMPVLHIAVTYSAVITTIRKRVLRVRLAWSPAQHRRIGRRAGHGHPERPHRDRDSVPLGPLRQRLAHAPPALQLRLSVRGVGPGLIGSEGATAVRALASLHMAVGAVLIPVLHRSSAR